MVREALRPIRFLDGRGYYFATRLDGLQILCASCPQWEQKNLIEVRDTKGAFVVRDMVALVRNHGEGYYRHTWSRPEAEGRDHEKLSYIKYFEPFDWFIGTGEYLEETKRDLQQEALDWIRKIRYDEEGYVFAGTWDGVSLSGPATGKNMLAVTDQNGVKIVQEMITGLSAWMDTKGHRTLDDICGRAVPNVSDWQYLNLNYIAKARIDQDACIKCGRCIREIGCPAITPDETGHAVINESLCTDCGLCTFLCPVKAIKKAVR